MALLSGAPAVMDSITYYITLVADTLCGYPLFALLIGGGLYLFLYSGMVSLRRLPAALKALRTSRSPRSGEISSLQALASVVAATVGMGNIAGVTIAIAMGGPGAVFWMWVSALVGMSTKYHEGVLAVKHRHIDRQGRPHGGPMYIIRHALPRSMRPLATLFAIAGMFGTLCIMNANQLTEAVTDTIASLTPIDNSTITVKFITGIAIAALVAAVTLGGIKRIARVATVMVPFMVTAYFLMVAYIILTHLHALPQAIGAIFSEAFNLQAGWGALAGIAIIGARRAALVNDAGIGTASIMHGTSSCREPVREGLVAMLGPAIDSGFVCTLTALAILLCGDLTDTTGRGLRIALDAFGSAIPAGRYMLMAIVACFALSSMFSYSFYGCRCAGYLFGTRGEKVYTYVFILSLILFAVVPLQAAVGFCDLFYALMALPTMATLIMLRSSVRAETRRYFRAPSPVKYQPI
ncbi:MAG: alanine:cation symporter family protein [Muribaculaceae bacterium]|nr:alanine:cation symporter family protein [Muribaculaceae bacterium]